MGKGHKSIVLPLKLPENSGACSLVWSDGFELHVCVEHPQAEEAAGDIHATVDLGEIHLTGVESRHPQAMDLNQIVTHSPAILLLPFR